MTDYLHLAKTLPPETQAEVITFQLTRAGAMVLALDDRTLHPSVTEVKTAVKRITYKAPVRDVLVILDDLQRRGDPLSGFDQPKAWLGIARANERLVRGQALIARLVGDIVEGPTPAAADALAQRNAAWGGLKA